MKKEDLNKYLFWAIMMVLVLLSFLIIKPFLIPLISAFILAYLTKPVYDYLSKKIPKSLSAGICILIVVLIIILPLSAIIGGVIQQANSSLNQKAIQTLFTAISSHPLSQKLGINLNELTDRGVNFIISLFTKAISQIPSMLVTLVIVFLGMYFILIDWETLTKKLKNYLPFKNKEKISKEISTITNHIVYGTILLALIQFAFAIAAFYLLGISFFLLLAIIIFFLAFIPNIGPGLVWVPLAFYYILTKNYSHAVGIIIIGLILTIFFDIILRAKILGKKISINPLVMLIGLLGGIAVFGIFGFIIGPLILLYTLKLIEELIKTS